MTAELTPELVRAAYLLFLGRPPESEQVVRHAMSYRTVDTLRTAFIEGAEFRGRLPAPAPRLVPVGAPPIAVEWEADAPEAERLLDHVRRTWTKLGEERPHWSVLSSDQFEPERIAANEASFFASGAIDCADLVAVLARHGRAPADFPRLVEFGCGLGRVTAHLARRFAHVTACDVSSSHMAVARQVIAAAGLSNVDFALAGSGAFGMGAPFDLWYSRIVLQHNPPPIMAMILRRALAMLAPGGMAVFQVPTYAAGYSFRLADYLAPDAGTGEIEMHVLPQPAVFAIARDAGCAPLEVIEDLSAGPSENWCSSMFVLRKG